MKQSNQDLAFAAVILLMIFFLGMGVASVATHNYDQTAKDLISIGNGR